MLKRKPLIMAILAIVFSVFCIERYLIKYQGDHTSLILMSSIRPTPPNTEHLSRETEGYDGQFYFLISQSPFSILPEGYLDWPARQTRILYCVLCWIGSGFGNPFALVWSMYVVNLLLVGAMAYIATDWAILKKCPSWWGLLAGLSTNGILSLARNLTDVSSTFCLVGLFIAWLSPARVWIIALWAAATIFAREQNIAVVGCLLLVAAWNRKWNLAFALGIVCLLWAGFIAWLWIGYGQKPFLPSEGNFGIPFQGYLVHYKRMLFAEKKIGTIERANLLIVIELGLMVFVGLYLTVRSRCWGLLIPILLGAALMIVSGIAVYEEIWAYGRVFNLLPIGVWFAAVERRWYWFPVLCVPNLLLVAAVATNRV